MVAILIHVFVALVAVLHFVFMILEMVFWTRPTGLRIFGQSKKQAESSAILAKNQGLYNGVLSAGLSWSLVHPTPAIALQIQTFFLGAVAVVGIYGALTVNISGQNALPVNWKLFFLQPFPALAGLALIIFA